MRISFLFAVVIQLRAAFVTQGFLVAPSVPSQQKNIFLSSVVESTQQGTSGLSGDEKLSGRILEGGQIIDFESMKGPSRAENALLQSRKELLEGDGHKVTSSPNGILGINSEVISEVGHELGVFAKPAEIQKCASILRAMAPPGMLKKRKDAILEGEKGIYSISDFRSDEKKELEFLLEKAYFEAGEVTEAFAKTFYMGTMLMPENAREAIWSIYVWCRRTDEIVDAPRDNDEEMLRDLSFWESRLEDLWEYGEVHDVFDLTLLDVRIKYPTLPITPFVDMIRGMLMDVPVLGQDRYETFDELHLYCYRVAGTVGLMSMPVFGCAPGITEEQAREPALSLGVAFQLTNILRDIGEDAVQRGRVYLPREDMERFGVTEEQLFQQRCDENFVNLMKYEISKARMYYERARRGVFMLAEESRLPVQASLDAYGEILDKIEENGYDSLTTRAYVDKWGKLAILPFSWYRTLDISRSLPLPGDKEIPELHI